MFTPINGATPAISRVVKGGLVDLEKYSGPVIEIRPNLTRSNRTGRQEFTEVRTLRVSLVYALNQENDLNRQAVADSFFDLAEELQVALYSFRPTQFSAMGEILEVSEVEDESYIVEGLMVFGIDGTFQRVVSLG